MEPKNCALPEFCVLLSYAEKNAQSKINRTVELCKGKVDLKLFLDSGAFTTWSTGKKINLNYYIQFIYDNNRKIEAYAVLDVVNDADKTFDNLHVMEDAGLSPLPVLYYGVQAYVLEEVCEDYPYFAIGGPGAVGVAKHREFSRHVFVNSVLKEKKTKVHGFGITTPESILELPYYSVDSTSWVQGRFGALRLWNPELKEMITWQRSQKTSVLNKIELLKNTVGYYGLGWKDFLERKNPSSYNKASIKSFLLLAKYIEETQNRKLRIYFAGVPSQYLQEEGFLSYLFSPLDGVEETRGLFYSKGIAKRALKEKKTKKKSKTPYSIKMLSRKLRKKNVSSETATTVT